MKKKLTQKQKLDRLNKLAKKIIESNQYISIATAKRSGDVWISPVAYTYDEMWNLYFVSIPASVHCKNAKKNSSVAVSVFDSQQDWGLGVGLQIKGTMNLVPIKDTLGVSKLYFGHKYPYGKITPKVAKSFMKMLTGKRQLYRFYKITPQQIFINDPYSNVDRREKVNINTF